MLFSSMTFVFVFLPILLLVYLCSKKELHNAILLIASIIFYAWGEPRYLAIMLLSIIVNYLGALAIEKHSKFKKLSLALTVIVNLGILIYFKYFNFILDNINNLFHANIDFIKIALPLGISFYTFQALSYVLDVYKSEVKAQKDIYKVALYICLFPQLIAGPILKYHDIEAQIDSREVNFEKVSYGVKRFIVGLSKKMLLANTFALVADNIFSSSPDSFSPLIAWIGAIFYSFQLFFDFSGYSDMAIGLGSIFGFKFMENFNYPYISKSISEFWRRWHISLSTWFKLYVYIPLGGNKNGLTRTCVNLGIVFLLTGIWHGANWTFIFWGIWNGFFIILEKLINLKEIEKKNNSVWLGFIQHIYCILVFVIGWVFFRSDSLGYAIKFIKNMFGLISLSELAKTNPMSFGVGTFEVIALIAGIICAIPVFTNMIQAEGKIKKTFVNIYLIILFIISAATIAAETYNPFIYFRF